MTERLDPLPAGWLWVRVRDVGEVQLGRQRAPEHHKGRHMRPYLRVANVLEDHISTADLLRMNFTPEEYAHYSLRYGDILLNEGQSRELVGRPAMFRDEVPGACFQNTLIRFRASDAILPEYALAVFRAYLHLGYFQEVCKWTTNIAHLGAKRFAEMPFPLPPRGEQERIAAALRSSLRRAAECAQRIDRAARLTEHLRQNALAAAVTGGLAGDDAASPAAARPGPDEWPVQPRASVCEEGRIVTYGVVKLGAEVPQGVPCLRTSDVRWLRIETQGVKRIAPEVSAQFSRTVLRGGEVLVNVRGTLGGVAVAGPEMAGWNVSREVAVVPADPRRVDPTFLAYWIGAEASQSWLRSVEKGIAYVGVNIEDLRNLPVRLPPLAEQHQIVQRVRDLLTRADALHARCRGAAARIERLIPAMLAGVLRGELVPQDPGEEPASDLLRRLRDAPKQVADTPPSTQVKVTPTMEKDERATVHAEILDIVAERCAIDELLAQVPSDYETTKEAIFELLEGRDPALRQHFDDQARIMYLLRGRT